MTTTHTLKDKGAAFTADGTRVQDGTGGTGAAVCSCGWFSEVLPSGSQRIAAHKDHKAHPEVTSSAEEPERSPEALGLEENEGDTMPGEGLEIDELELDESDDPEDPAYELLFTGIHAGTFAKYALQKAEEAALEPVLQSQGQRRRRLEVRGSSHDVATFIDLVASAEEDILKALKVWQKENLQNRPKGSQARYLADREFILETLASYTPQAAEVEPEPEPEPEPKPKPKAKRSKAKAKAQ